MKLFNKINSWKGYTVIILLLILFSISFWNSNVLIITITRLPIFFLGMCFANEANKEKRQDKKLSKLEILTMILLTIIGTVLLFYFKGNYRKIMWKYGLYWYPFILITPGILITISWISMIIEKSKTGKILINILRELGKYTFEIYLVHALVFKIVKEYISMGIIKGTNKEWIIAILISALGCVILKLLTILITKLTIGINKHFNKKGKHNKLITQ